MEFAATLSERMTADQSWVIPLLQDSPDQGGRHVELAGSQSCRTSAIVQEYPRALNQETGGCMLSIAISLKGIGEFFPVPPVCRRF